MKFLKYSDFLNESIDKIKLDLGIIPFIKKRILTPLTAVNAKHQLKRQSNMIDDYLNSLYNSFNKEETDIDIEKINSPIISQIDKPSDKESSDKESSDKETTIDNNSDIEDIQAITPDSINTMSDKQLDKEISMQENIVKDINKVKIKIENEYDQAMRGKTGATTNHMIEKYTKLLDSAQRKLNRVNADLDLEKKILASLKDEKKKRVISENLVWDEKNMKELTYLVNPYKIRKHFLLAESIIDRSPDDKKKSLSSYWERLINELKEKWYKIFDSDVFSANMKGYSLSDKKHMKKKAEIGFILNDLTKNKVFDLYEVNKITDGKYFLMTDGNILLLVKLITKKERIYFSCIAEISIDNNDLVIKQLFEYNNSIKMNIDKKDISLYSDKYIKHPIIILSDDNIWSTKDFNTFDKIKSDNIKISPLSKKAYNELIKGNEKNISAQAETFLKNKLKDNDNKEI